jgi:chitin disaccharide deacetylase
MRYLIVNADDFGASPGSNRGIVAAHQNGIVTSTSLMVDTPWSADAAALAAGVPDLSVGVHLDLDRVGPADVARALARQYDRFLELLGSPPTHLDSHHDRHGQPDLLPETLHFARARGLPLRGHSVAHACSKFYGQWGGETHFEQISVAGLGRVLAGCVREGVIELSCHPGYPDAALHSSYLAEREVEVRTLCDPAAREVVAALDLHLISFRDLADLGKARRAQGIAS